MNSDAKPSIVKVLAHYYGVEESDLPGFRSGWRPMHCPMPDHEDRTKSAGINTTLQAWKCLACGAGGDSWKIIMDQEGVSFGEAVEFAARQFGTENTSIRRPAKQRRTYKPTWLDLS